MSRKYTNILSADALAALVNHNSSADPSSTGSSSSHVPLLLLDCRARLGDPDWGLVTYLDNHLPGALHADLDRVLAAPPGTGGRHPLPARADWLATVREWGLTSQHQVVTYDDAGGAFAARAWWMLRWLGHAHVAVLDGGTALWQGVWESGPPHTPAPSDYAAGEPLTRLASMASMQDPDYRARHHLMDARAQARFAGREEPIDPVAGHIPGAVCLPMQDNLTPQGRFKSRADLHARFAPLAAGEAVSYCGSGVTACHNILAMHIAGLPEPALFAESWSGWITDPGRPVARD